MNDFGGLPNPKPWWYQTIIILAKSVFRTFGKLQSIGKENIPMSGPVIIAPIHLSHADPPAVACASPRHFFFMAKEELFRGLFGKLIFSVGAFPVNRDSNDTEAVRKAIALLQKGEALVLFPEGSRGDGQRLGKLSKGVALLAKMTGARVVPVGISGTSTLLPKGKGGLHRAKVNVVFGPSFTFAESAPEGAKATAETFNQYLIDQLIKAAGQAGTKLLPPLNESKTEPGTEPS